MESIDYDREGETLQVKPQVLSIAVRRTALALAAGLTLSLNVQATELNSEEAAPEIATGI